MLHHPKNKQKLLKITDIIKNLKIINPKTYINILIDKNVKIICYFFIKYVDIYMNVI